MEDKKKADDVGFYKNDRINSAPIEIFDEVNYVQNQELTPYLREQLELYDIQQSNKTYDKGPYKDFDFGQFIY